MANSKNKALLSSVASFAAPDTLTGSADKGISKADKALLKTIRSTFESETGHDCKVTDQGILDIVQNVTKAKFIEMDLEDQIALFVKAEEAFKGIAISDPSINGLVARFDEPFYAETETCIEAFIKSKQSTLDILGQLKRVWSKDQFDNCPYPGSTADDVKGTNYSPDIVEKKAVAGGKIRTVFTDDLVYATPMGKRFQTDMDDATNELKVSGSVTRFKGKGKQELRDIFNTAKQHRDALRKMFRTSIQLHHKLSAIDGMPLVKWSWIKGSDPKCPVMPKDYRSAEFFKISRSTKPIWLVPVVDGEPDHAKGKEYSASQIIAFDPAKALTMPEGGTVGNLIDSAKGEPDTPETMGEKMSVEEFDTGLVVFNARLSNTAERAALRKRAVEPNNEDLRESVCALYLNLKGFYDANAKWYDERINGKSEPQKKTGTDD